MTNTTIELPKTLIDMQSRRREESETATEIDASEQRMGCIQAPWDVLATVAAAVAFQYREEKRLIEEIRDCNKHAKMDTGPLNKLELAVEMFSQHFDLSDYLED